MGKRIGILTFHNGINYGAYFQCFSLYKHLESLGHQPEVINYKSFSFWFKEKKHLLYNKPKYHRSWEVLWKNFKKIRQFKIAQKEIVNSPLTFSHSKINDLSHKYDFIVVGSDIVWCFDDDLIGFDPIYFGYYLNPKKLISYAPSFGPTSPEVNLSDEIKKGLLKFDNISVRDENSKNIIDRNLHISPPVVLDPTFLIDDLNKYGKPIKDDGYILVYSYHTPKKYIKYLKKYAKNEGLKLIAVGYYCDWCDKNILNISPFKWLTFFKNASLVITSTYHGTIFSLLNRKPFVTIDNKPTHYKTGQLLKSFKINNRLINSLPDFKEQINTEINYKSVEKYMNKETEKSKSYLNESLL
jgi:polysaccharide pyruvyl transferase WcaK-like protein